MEQSLRSVCVFCGSRFGNDPQYTLVAQELGKLIGINGLRLVYGAGDVGLMGEIAKATQENGGKILGVIPNHLLKLEVAKTDLDTFIVTENMHERKKVMFSNSDIIVVMPGGVGTLEEFFEVLTWKQLGLHTKDIILLNVEGFWNNLVGLIEGLVESKFANKKILSQFIVVNSVKELTTIILEKPSNQKPTLFS
ncbi:MAG: TIGR00730 family Rossman fold protein [Proteobacteria bacterium]|nr:TIGR00730 family Rossman fold protein [Pseudomonadota bacterium]